MYGTQTTATAAGGTLAMTGATTGSWALIAVGLLVGGFALWTLARKFGKNRP